MVSAIAPPAWELPMPDDRVVAFTDAKALPLLLHAKASVMGSFPCRRAIIDTFYVLPNIFVFVNRVKFCISPHIIKLSALRGKMENFLQLCKF
jgi:hypothetical protein